MHVELLQILEAGEAVPLVDELRAVSYRLLPGAGTTASSLEAWSGKLAVGSPLPNLPLWLDRESSVPLDLEQSYAAACRALRIHE
jgi:hypothetical protein